MSQNFNSSRWPVTSALPNAAHILLAIFHEHIQMQSALHLRNCSPVLDSLLFIQVHLVNLLILYLFIFVILLGGEGRLGGLCARGGAAHVFCALELINATGQQHAIAVQHHGALAAGLGGKRKGHVARGRSLSNFHFNFDKVIFVELLLIETILKDLSINESLA